MEQEGEAKADPDEVPDAAEKIRELAESDQAEHALDLVKSLNDPKLYAELLEDCWIDGGGEVHLSQF